MGFLANIGDAIAAKIVPIIQRELKKHAEVLIPKVMDTIADEFEKRIPALTAALVTAVTEAASRFAVDAADRVTDFIPGQVDDAIVDPIVKNAMDIFRENLKRFGL